MATSPSVVEGISFPQLYKLTSTSNPSYKDQDTFGNQYYWNFCSDEIGVNCDLNQSAVCQERPGGFAGSCGITTNQTITLGTKANPKDGVTFTYGAGRFGCGRQRETTIEVACNKTATTPIVSSPPIETPPRSCIYHIGMQSAFACADKPNFSCCSYFKDDMFQFSQCALFEQCHTIPPFTLQSKPIVNCDDCLE